MEPINQPTEQQRGDHSIRADLALYDALVASSLPGKVYFDLNVGQQVDIFAWIPGKGRFAFEAKGSLHWIEDGKWLFLDRNHNQTEARPTPADQARRGALAASDALEKRLNDHKPWIHAVLVLTNVSEPDAAIDQFARDRRVHVIWGLHDIDAQLQEIINKGEDFNPPTELDIEAEAGAFDYRDPPPGWQPKVPAERSVKTRSEPRKTPPAEPVAAASNSTVIYNYGTIIFQQPFSDGRPPAHPDWSNSPPGTTAGPHPSRPIGPEGDPFDDGLPVW